MALTTEMAIGYVRVSTGRQGDSIEAQDGALRAWCSSKGIALVQMFSETISAGKSLGERLGVLDAVCAVGDHKAAYLVAVARDRFARDAVEMAVIERMVMRVGGQLTTTDGASTGTGPEGALIRSILDAVAQFERVQISVRTRRVMQHKRERGEKYTGKPPYGKRLDGNRFINDDYEQRVIARVCLARHAGLTWAAICALLTEDGYKPRGAKWHTNTLRRIWAVANVKP